ncbi:FAD-dependent oxidoreductase [Prauserella cavernicola]|uniref:FAD-binding protein n=1 Tax=Prauserella cavernicola TaxID=2800127 RepID=A0A934QPT2_9PSEU|nr:FAD-binding protein [Prauserella cavernicola]MBK1783828.1 FAD-binding protein [Prauserella cavernicola]
MSRSQGHAVSRRALLAGAGAAGGALGAGLIAPATAAPEPEAFGPVRIGRGEARYGSLLRGNNFRFVGDPDEIQVIGSTSQVVRAVTEAVASGRRVAVRSGGHCFEDFTADAGVRVLLDLSPMDSVTYDPAMRAFEVQPGATLGRVYRKLYQGWGVTVPGGSCPGVGAGGHFAGGGYGALSRRYGSVVDHLYAVEVVVVGRNGKARAVIATREPDDPNRDLWWAHTGGGGGNVGVVTRYWLRSPGATGEPSRLLPTSPATMLEHAVAWSWESMTEQDFSRLLHNFGTWHERNSAPGSPATNLYGLFVLSHSSAGAFALLAQIDADVPGANDLVAEFVAAVSEGVEVEPVFSGSTSTAWLHRMTWAGSGESGDATTRRYKNKAGYLRRSMTERQRAAVYRYLTDPAGVPSAGVLLLGYGGQVNAVAQGDTAIAQRDSVMKVIYYTTWADEEGDEAHLAWVRSFYRDVYADTGGVPVPDEVNDGSYINYPDNDLLDPAWNTSGVSARTLYYKDNYARLRRIKARWDPRDEFRHALSIEPAG